MRRVVGYMKHQARLRRLSGAEAQSKLGKVVYVGADKVRTEARRLIANGAIQGKGHIPSAAGEPPNWDTGHLANNITTRKGPNATQAQTASEAGYAEDLEFGTSKMAARPYMRPATQNKRSEVVEDVANTINNIIRRK